MSPVYAQTATCTSAIPPLLPAPAQGPDVASSVTCTCFPATSKGLLALAGSLPRLEFGNCAGDTRSFSNPTPRPSMYLFNKDLPSEQWAPVRAWVGPGPAHSSGGPGVSAGRTPAPRARRRVPRGAAAAFTFQVLVSPPASGLRAPEEFRQPREGRVFPSPLP